MSIKLPSLPWYRRRIHFSWHIALASVGVIVGVALAPQFDQLFLGSAWLVVAVTLTLVAAFKQTLPFLMFALVAGLTLGLWRGTDQYSSLKEYAPYFGRVVVVEGAVTEDVSYGQNGDQRFRMGKVRVDGQPLTGVVWVSVAGKHDIKRGDFVALEGKLQKGFGNIPASLFRAQVQQVERPTPGDVGRRVRDWFAKGVHASMPETEAQLSLAYLLGQKITLSNDINEQLRVAGLVHAVVASGFHLTVLIGVTRRLFVRYSKYLTAALSMGMMSGFILITGFSPSMTRAGLVSGLSLLAWYYGRVIHPLVVLPFAAALTVVYQPAYIWGDVGWYLSFAAFAGVLVLAPLLHDYFWGKQSRPGIIREVVVATIAAQIVTLPITMHVFGYYAMYALLANVLVVPLIPLTMLLTFVSGILGIVFSAIATLFGLPVVWLLRYMLWVVEWVSGLPNAAIEVTFGIGSIIWSYTAISLLIYWLWRTTKHNFRRDILTQKEF